MKTPTETFIQSLLDQVNHKIQAGLDSEPLNDIAEAIRKVQGRCRYAAEREEWIDTVEAHNRRVQRFFICPCCEQSPLERAFHIIEGLAYPFKNQRGEE